MDHHIWVKVPLIHDRRLSYWPPMTRKSSKTRWNDERDRFSSIIYQLVEFKVLIWFKVFINKCHAGHFNTFASTLNGDSRVKFIHDWFLGYLGPEWGSFTPELFKPCIQDSVSKFYECKILYPFRSFFCWIVLVKTCRRGCYRNRGILFGEVSSCLKHYRLSIYAQNGTQKMSNGSFFLRTPSILTISAKLSTIQ